MEKLTRDLEQMQAPFHHETDGEGEKIGPKAGSERQISKRHRRGLVLKDKIQIHLSKLEAFYSMAPLLFSSYPLLPSPNTSFQPEIPIYHHPELTFTSNVAPASF